MKLITKTFQEAANKIREASSLDSTAVNLELIVDGDYLKMNVTNKEYYVSVSFLLNTPEPFRAVVAAPLFLDLISGITTDTFDIVVDNTVVLIKYGKSKNKITMIFEKDQIMALPKITLQNVTKHFNIKNEILASILNVNSKELQKAKRLDTNELQKMYYIDETGCFTFTTGACLNSFTLAEPIKLLLNERIVKLFKLFKDEEVDFKFGYDADFDNVARPKVVFTVPGVYVAARVNCDDVLLGKVKGPCNAIKNFIAENYSNQLVLSSDLLLNAINRLMLFSKNSATKTTNGLTTADINFTPDEFYLTDALGNTEVVPIENNSSIDTTYTMRINLSDFKSVLDSCKGLSITLQCGNHRSVIISRGNICNVIPEVKIH